MNRHRAVVIGFGRSEGLAELDDVKDIDPAGSKRSLLE
jgi:hypothetical protein